MQANETLIFTDTEFSDLTNDAELLSIGLIDLRGQRLYLERTDYDPYGISDFVSENVFPLMDAPADAKLPAAELCIRLTNWLSGFENPVLVVDSQWDVHVVHRMFSMHGRGTKPSSLKFRLLALTAYEFERRYEPGFNEYFEQNPGKQHHALHDALAMRQGWLRTQGY